MGALNREKNSKIYLGVDERGLYVTVVCMCVSVCTCSCLATKVSMG